MHQSNHIKEAREFIQSKADLVPEIGMILGSGLGDLADELEDAVVIPYEEIPHFFKIGCYWACKPACHWYSKRKTYCSHERPLPLL